MSKEKLLELKKEVEELESEYLKASGVQDTLMKELEQMGYSSIEEAEAKLEVMEKRKEKLDKKLTKLLQEAEEMLA